jgi:hypothetical protein
MSRGPLFADPAAFLSTFLALVLQFVLDVFVIVDFLGVANGKLLDCANMDIRHIQIIRWFIFPFMLLL